MIAATMRNKSVARIAATLAVALLPAVPMFAARGSADFTRFVAIGDSYGAGYESNSLNERHQQYSWPAVIAKQAGIPLCTATSTATENCFAQPLVSYPGIGAEMVLIDVKPTIGLAPGSGTPVMTAFGRPYNNLSIPGANVADVTKLTGAEAQPTRSVEQLARFILRGLGTEVDQALAQKPTFIAIWIGGNDFLGSVSGGTTAALTPTATFRSAYDAMLDKLVAGAPNAGIVVGTLPTNPGSVPLLNTVPPFAVDPNTRQPILGPDGKPIYYIADLGGGKFGQLPAGSYVLLSALSKIQTGFGLPGVAPFTSLFPNAGKPLSDADVITPDEIATITSRIAEYNDAIKASAASHNVAVADITGLFDRFAKNQVFLGPFQLTSAYITGGIFSLDGVHLTDIGYTLFANEYIKAINNAYGTRIPLASVTQFFDNNGANFGAAAYGLPDNDTSRLAITPDAANDMLKVLQPPATSTTPRRGRAVSH